MDKQRDLGLDIYRIMLAVSVILVHFCTYSTGGALKNVEMNTPQYYVGWILFSAVIPAVNSYALLSGFLSFGHKHTLRKPFVFWVELFTYSLLITLIAKIWINVSIKELLMSFVPLTSGNWWYINIYIIVSLLMPAMDYIVENVSPKEYYKTVIILLALICGSNMLCLQHDVWFLNDGYTVFWIAFLYIIGSGIKKYRLYEKMSKEKWGVCWALCVVITACSRFVIENLSKELLGNKLGGGLMFNYLSITVVASAICSLCFFITIDCHKHSRIISFIATGSFASYIIHIHPQFKSIFIQDRFLQYGTRPVFGGTGKMIVMAVLIVIISATVDCARRWGFKNIRYYVINRIIKYKEQT